MNNEATALAEGDFYYEELGGGRYRSTIHAQGAWNPHEQHMAPATGILTHAIQRFEPREELRIARMSLDIHGLIPGGEIEIHTRMIRPGRTIELVEAEMIGGGRTCIVARAWRLITGDTTAVAAVEDTPVTGPEQLSPSEGMDVWPGGYIRGLEFREVPGRRAGRGVVWLRTPYPLVRGVETAPVERLLGLVDTANGVAPRAEPGPNSWMFPNVDLQIHLHRTPVGQWLGLEAQQTYGADGIGLTSAVLHDVEGPFGRSEQILTVRPAPGS
ncbi:thioesterase family protein [Nesterenkonia aerolata]|uniref:Thioesterase family protein n=1 Tax=Nesterenkonia aerolata TaxID=3074079 RepID=A0ABU2DQD3_9MICC|nr:thioesterase family protein [Nesterenkonia sp. LY-0111]MDR8018718.1 thioesterase family protein [Nesterenkonia sp. LY-0111]